jgi:hypothetical protein
MRLRIALLALGVATMLPASAAASSCVIHGNPHGAFVSQAPVPADWAAQLGVLRRPQTDADRAREKEFSGGEMLRILYGNSVRLLRTDPDGRQWYLFLGKPAVHRLPHRCLAGLSPHQQRVIKRGEQRQRERAKVVAMGVFEFKGPGGGGGFGTDLKTLLTKPSGGSFGGAHSGTTVYAVVPDGVATVDLTFGDGSKQSATVGGNLWTVPFDGGAPSGFPKTTVWRAADGSVIRTLRSR